jgi:MoaA/NifB/PqqE/SkfB family radical SAM enzyme
VSPFVNLDQVYTLIDNCKQWCAQDRKIKWIITGGEPFLDPNFTQVLELLHSQPFTEQINTISNGSLPLKKYLQAAKFVAGITFSLHFERSTEELNKTIDTIIAVKKQTTVLVSVNVMFLPNRATDIQLAIDKLKKNQVSYIVRLITPVDVEANKIKPYTNSTAKRKHILLKSSSDQSRDRQQFKIKNDETASNNIQNYYSNDELVLVKQLNNATPWQNAGVWADDNTYQEINTDQLVSAGKNRFKNWICYAGVDSVYIDWDGTVFRGMCLNDGPIGHINTDFITTTPTKCQLNHCVCSIDIAVRKAVNVTHLPLITN